MRAALCHEWLTSYGGAEQVSQRIVAALDIRDVYTFAAAPDVATALFPDHRVRVHPLGLTRLGRERWPWLLPAMPSAWRRLDLGEYDLVVTSSHACTNAIRTRPDALHVSYCHTPMRYAWYWRSELGRFPAPLRPLWPAAAAAFRAADRRWAANVDLFVANSRNTAERIHRCYGRSSVVVHPPVALSFWTPDPTEPREDFFLFAGRLVAYKRPDLAVEAAASAGVRLLVAGAGPELPRLRAIAPPQVEFVESPSNARLRSLYRRAQALVFPGVEDFGMTLVEAQACGTPVVALDAGGARESVIDGETGVLYREPTATGLARVLGSFDARRFAVDTLRRQAERFGPERFDAAIREAVATGARR